MTTEDSGQKPNGEENQFPGGVGANIPSTHSKKNSLKQFIIDSYTNSEFGPFPKILMSYLISKSPNGQDDVKMWLVYTILWFIVGNILLGFFVTILEFRELIIPFFSGLICESAVRRV